MEPPVVERDAVTRAAPSDFFTTDKYAAKVADARPWRPEHGVAAAGGGPLSPGKPSHRQHLRDVAKISEGRAVMLQQYLVSQLANGSLSDELSATFEAAIVQQQQPRSATASPNGAAAAGTSPKRSPKKRRSPGKGLNISAQASALIESRNANGDASPLFGTSMRRSFSPNHRRRPGAVVPGDRSTYAVSSDYDIGVGATALLNTSTRGTLTKWPGFSEKTTTSDLLAVQRPPQLVADDGMVFFDQGLDKRPEALTAFPDIRGSPSPASPTKQPSSVSRSLSKTAPKLLKDLEYFLNAELEEGNVDGEAHVGNPERTRIFFECLDCFIEHCATYKPLLAKIKAELESVISEQRRQINALQPVQLKLATLEGTTAADRIRLEKRFQSDTADLHDELQETRRQRNEARAKVTRLQEQLEKNEKELERLRDNAAADWEQNTTLSVALNHHKLLAKDTAKIYNEREELKMQYATAQKKITDLTLRCNGTVSTDEFNAMKKKFEQSEMERNKAERKLAGAINKLETAAINKASLMRRVDEYQTLNNELKSVGTPRPQNMPRELSRLDIDMGSPAGTYARADAIFKRFVVELDISRATIIELRKIAPDDHPYFFGRGSDDSVPLYLRTHKIGQVLRNTRMKRLEVEDTVGSILRAKRRRDAELKAAGEPASTLPQAMLEYCTAQVDTSGGGQNEIAELATNLLDGCKRHAITPEVELFGKMLYGTLSPGVQSSLETYLRNLRAKLAALAWTETPKGPKPKKGSPSKPEIIALITAGPVMTSDDGTEQPDPPSRTEDEIARLQQALDTDAPQKKGAVNLDALFDEDPQLGEDGSVGEMPPPRLFVAELRHQWLRTREAFHDDIAAAIVEQDKERRGDVNVPQLRAAVKAADPGRTDVQVDELLREGILLAGEAYGRPDEEVMGTVARRTVMEGPPLKGLLCRGQELPHEDFRFDIQEFMQMLRRSDTLRVTGSESESELEPEPEPEPAEPEA